MQSARRGVCSIWTILNACLAFHIPPQVSSVWPLPVNISSGTTALYLSPTFSIACDASCPLPLPNALARYKDLILIAGVPDPLPHENTVLSSLVVRIAAAAPLSLGVDEYYNLTIPADGTPAIIWAKTQWGALRGLESFSQLCVWQGPDGVTAAAYAITNAPVIIEDFPRFPVRGVLIDTSFNWLTTESVEATLDSMATLKANVLHWHITDDPAWSVEIEAFPNFTDPRYDGPLNSQAFYTVREQVRKYAGGLTYRVMCIHDMCRLVLLNMHGLVASCC